MATSFISEHTAEFCLVPQFAEILSKQYRSVIPFFYWASREGGKMAKESMDGTLVKIVALYARRPKITNANHASIQVKFNERLFVRAKNLQVNGIAVFAGVPLASSLLDYNLESNCAWFSFNDNGIEELVDIDLEETFINLPTHVNRLSCRDILDKVERQCRLMTWTEAIDCFKLKPGLHSRLYSGFGMWGEIYKPVYFVLLEKDAK